MTRILFFGAIRDAAGCAEMDVALPADVDCLERLRDWLAARDPLLGEALRARGVRAAIDRAFVEADARLASPEEIAFMSPLSGG